MSQTSRKRVLIVTYYWPPSGGVAVQRWLKFVKYLRDFGWEPIVYTPENPESFYDDHSLFKDIPENIEVIKRPIWEPYDIYKWITGRKGKKLGLGFADDSDKKGGLAKLMVWIRGNILIPDPRVFWVRPSVKFLKRYLKQHPVDAIVTTGPPHSMHLIGLNLKRKLNIPWLADFRDPWTNIDFYHELRLTKFANWYHHRLERKVVQTADYVVVVSQQMKREFESLGSNKVLVLTNGFDTDDIPAGETQRNDSFSICYVGTMNSARNPHVLWQALSRICAENAEFAQKLRIQMAGQIDISVTTAIKSYGLEKNFEHHGLLPHDRALALQKNAQILLLVINNTPNAKGIVTGKFFEYLAVGKQILTIGPTDSDIAEIVHETASGDVIDYTDVDGATQTLVKYFNLFKQGNLTPEPKGIEKYSRKALTGRLSEILNQITNG
ncbi:MAG: glycosyltransferase family 4 protein [Tenuifilum sp.]|uniref:glycosyltransferase family 4 protein n=1 Tax=Tenuifilum sp. TaxID=2760880 RepID=UPI0030A566FE